MLKDKGTVRLRTVLSNGTIDGTEQLVSLDNLAWTIRDLLPTSCGGNDDHLFLPRDQISHSGQVHQSNNYRDGNTGNNTNYRSTSSTMETSIECIYVQNDQFFDSERSASKVDKTQSRNIAKTMRGITQRAEAFVRSMANPGDGPSNDLPVFIVNDVSFWCLREFGSHLMRMTDHNINDKQHQWSANKACLETIESHPKYKRSLKTLGAAIDSYVKRHSFWTGGSAGEKHNHNQHQEAILLLYSKPDDRFDMITLQC